MRREQVLWFFGAFFVLLAVTAVRAEDEEESDQPQDAPPSHGHGPPHHGGGGGHGHGGGGHGPPAKHGGGQGWGQQGGGQGGHGGQGWSQQYHYSSYPGGPGKGGWSGITIDLSNGTLLTFGLVIIILAFFSIIYPLLGHNRGGSQTGWGWESGAESVPVAQNAYRSYNVAGTAEQVLKAVDKAYKVYSKSH